MSHEISAALKILNKMILILQTTIHLPQLSSTVIPLQCHSYLIIRPKPNWKKWMKKFLCSLLLETNFVFIWCQGFGLILKKSKRFHSSSQKHRRSRLTPRNIWKKSLVMKLSWYSDLLSSWSRLVDRAMNLRPSLVHTSKY